ncbi:unnamed protein product, partial [Prorocentrum cordatum]
AALSALEGRRPTAAGAGGARARGGAAEHVGQAAAAAPTAVRGHPVPGRRHPRGRAHRAAARGRDGRWARARFRRGPGARAVVAEHRRDAAAAQRGGAQGVAPLPGCAGPLARALAMVGAALERLRPWAGQRRGVRRLEERPGGAGLAQRVRRRPPRLPRGALARPGRPAHRARWREAPVRPAPPLAGALPRQPAWRWRRRGPGRLRRLLHAARGLQLLRHGGVRGGPRRRRGPARSRRVPGAARAALARGATQAVAESCEPGARSWLDEAWWRAFDAACGSAPPGAPCRISCGGGGRGQKKWPGCAG